MQDVADSHATCKCESEAQAHERCAYEEKQKRLARKRVTARRSRERKREYLRSLRHRVDSLEWERLRLKRAVLQRDEQLVQMRSLPATQPRESFDGVHKGLQPGKDKLLRSSPKRTLPSAVLATSNNHVGTSQPSSSQTAHVEHHISMENISSQHTEPCEVFAIQDATLKATSSMSDPMDQGQDLPDYLANFLLDSSGQVRHTSLSALDNLEITSQADWACNHLEPKTLEEAQTKSSVQSVQDAASSWSVSCSQPDVQHGDFTTLSSPFYASSLSAERQVYGTQDEGVTYIDCTSIGDWTEAPPSLSAAAQAEQTRPHQWDPLQCTTSVLSSNRHGIARQDVRFGLSRGFSQQLVGPA